MKSLPFFLTFCIGLLFASSQLQAQTIQLTNLQCEYKINPLGMDERSPRLSWQLKTQERAIMQSAYQIRVAHSKEALQAGPFVWDSGKVLSSESNLLDYQGPALESRQVYYWQVKIWDQNDHSTAWSAIQSWEMGLLDESDWSAQWIEPGLPDDITQPSPAPLLRYEFDINQKIRSARAYITAHGLYEGYLNGQKIGDELFTPGWTSYNTRVQYQTYNVTDLLQVGTNAIGMMLGDGWYRGFIGFRGRRNFYGDQLGLLMQLEVTYDNGEKEIITSNPQWRSTHGPILFSDIYNGESYDARKEKINWAKPDYADENWQFAKKKTGGYSALIAPVAPPVKAIEILSAKKIMTTPKGETVVDFGQNLVGRIRLKVRAASGTSIRIQHAEVLDKAGNFYTENLREAKQEVTYICSGRGVETYEPYFSFQGFRYVKLEGYPGTLSSEDIEAVVIHSEMEVDGHFECSEPLINQLQHNILWGQKGNFLDVPTDCPQRDERLGWTGDAQAFSRTAAFNMDVASFFNKWLQDLEADQLDNGKVPFVIPNVLGPNQTAATGWADAATIIPWNMYLAYGDKRVLERQYKSMQAWVGFMEKEAGDTYLWNTGFHFGDWLFYSLNDDRDGKSAITDKYLLAQAFFAHSTELLLKSAKLLGKQKDVVYYETLLQKVKAAFINEYITPSGRLVSSTQTAYVLALLFDLFPAHQQEQAVKRLVDNIARYSNHLTTGFLGTPHLCHVLSENGYKDLAYTLLQQESYPSWLYPVTMGATTIWERWDGIRPDSTFQNSSMNSFNHYAYGAIGDWLYRVVAGIEIDEAQPGYKHIYIQPQPGGTLTHASAWHETPYGRLSSAWQIKDGQFALELAIPANVRATVRLPQAKREEVKESEQVLASVKEVHSVVQEASALVLELGSGNYRFTYPATALLKAYRAYSLEDSLATLLANPESKKVLKKYMPSLIRHPQMEKIKNQSITELVKSFVVLDDSQLGLMDQALRKIAKPKEKAE